MHALLLFLLFDRRPGGESDTESSRETSSDGSSEYGADRGVNNVLQWNWTQQNVVDANIKSLNRLSLRNKPFRGSSSDECEISNPSGQLVFEYMEHASPFTRQPLADKASSCLCSINMLLSWFSTPIPPDGHTIVTYI